MEVNLDVQKTSRTSSERLMYVQFTSCEQEVAASGRVGAVKTETIKICELAEFAIKQTSRESHSKNNFFVFFFKFTKTKKNK